MAGKRPNSLLVRLWRWRATRPLVTLFLYARKYIRRAIRRLGKTWLFTGWRRYVTASAALLIFITAAAPVISQIIISLRYRLDDKTVALVGGVNQNLAAKFSYDEEGKTWQFNKDGILKAKAEEMTSGLNKDKKFDPGSPEAIAAAKAQMNVGGAGKDDKSYYSVNLPQDGKKGIEYYDTNTNLHFSLVPQFDVQPGREYGGRLVYLLEKGGKLVYTAKNNGMKEDIVMSHNVGDVLQFDYKLDLPETLTAKVMSDGSVGIFSPDTALFGDISYGSDTDREKMVSARQSAEKDHLLFSIPAPEIRDSSATHAARGASAVFEIHDGILQVKARGLSQLEYPISIDPTVVITSTSEFQSGKNDSNITFGTDEIKRAAVTGGSVGTWGSPSCGTMNGATGVYNGGSATYNGYIYHVGGTSTANVYYAPLDASTGACTSNWSTTTSLGSLRLYSSAIAYNGYMYTYGGVANNGTTALADVRYAVINSNGTLGSWTTSANSMATGNCRFGAAAYNGYLYAVGGTTGTVNTDCGNTSTNNTDDVQFAPIKANGDVGTWTTSANGIPTALKSPGVAIYNGFMYTAGGTTDGSVSFDTVSYARITTTGDIGAFTSFATAYDMDDNNYRHAFIAYNGYLYQLGGTNDGAELWYSMIKEDGTISTWKQSSSISTGRYGHGLVGYNNRLYYFGGNNGSGLNDTGYVDISTAGASSTFFNDLSTYPAAARRGVKTVAMKGFLYTIGGEDGTNATTGVNRAPINPDGDNAGNTSQTTLTNARSYAGIAVDKDFIYVVAGCNDDLANCTTGAVNTTYYAQVDSTGGITAWNSGSTMNTARYGLTAAIYNGYIYAIGGLNGSTFRDDVEYNNIDSDGDITGSWTVSTYAINTSTRAYHDSFVYAGKLYVVGGCTAGATTCTSSASDIQYATFGSSGEFTADFTTNSNSFTTSRGMHVAVASQGVMYVIGGYDGTTYYNTTQRADIASDGSVGTFTAGPNLTEPRASAGGTVHNGVVHIVAGHNGTSIVQFVNWARLNNGGGGHPSSTWTTTAANVGTYGGYGTAMYNGYLYRAGGDTNGSCLGSNTSYYVAIASDGTVGNWTAGPNLNGNRCDNGLLAVNGYLYAVMGYHSGSEIGTTEYAAIGSDGSIGSWTVATADLSASNERDGSGYVAHNGYIYVLGGNGSCTTGDGNGNCKDVNYAAVGSGNFSSWSTTTDLPDFIMFPGVAVVNGYMYAIGGHKGGADTNHTASYYAVVNGNGTLGSWTRTTESRVAGKTRAVAYNGMIYAISEDELGIMPVTSAGPLGAAEHFGYTPQDYSYGIFGFKGRLYTVGDGGEINHSALNSTTRAGSYTKIFDIGAGKVPLSISYNGVLAAGTYAFNYRTADQDGDFGTLTSGVNAFSSNAACNTSATDAVMINMRLDGSGESVYPDSASAFTSLSDVTLTYGNSRAPTNQRLAHGKFFFGEVLQPLDTCQ
jgi:hypothetical protein